MRYRPRSLFSFSWLALIVVAFLMVLAPIASAQSATSAPTLSKLDAYTLDVPAPLVTDIKFNLVVPVPVQANLPSPWSGAFFYDIKGGHMDAVILNKILDLTKNTKLSGFSLYGFAGTTVNKDGKAVAGLAIGKDWKWFDQVSFFTGIGVSFSASTPIGGGIIVGASVHF